MFQMIYHECHNLQNPKDCDLLQFRRSWIHMSCPHIVLRCNPDYASLKSNAAQDEYEIPKPFLQESNRDAGNQTIYWWANYVQTYHWNSLSPRFVNSSHHQPFVSFMKTRI